MLHVAGALPAWLLADILPVNLVRNIGLLPRDGGERGMAGDGRVIVEQQGIGSAALPAES